MTRAGDEVRLVPTKKRHTWINAIDLQVRKDEEMFIQDIKGGPSFDKALEIIKREKIDFTVGQKKFWDAIKPFVDTDTGRVSQDECYRARRHLIAQQEEENQREGMY